MTKKIFFDNIVVGSSPLMLLVAISIAKKGENVLLIDKDSNFGGCWKIKRIKKLKFETASHLIERYPEVYELLEDNSSMEFKPLENNPIRVFRNGLIINYYSKLTLFLTFLKLNLGYFYYTLLKLLFRKKKEKQLNYHYKIKDFFKYRFKNFFQSYLLLGPKNGYASLLDGLLMKCDNLGINFKKGEVISINYSDNFWNVKLKNKDFYYCKYLHSTTSINLKKISKTEFISFKPQVYKKTSVLIKIPLENIFIKQSYVSFIGDKFVSRIHRIDRKGEEGKIVYYLAEIKSNKYFPFDKTKKIIEDRLTISKIIKKNQNFYLLQTFSTKFSKNTDQLNIKNITNFKTYFSNGNLAAGIHKWIVE